MARDNSGDEHDLRIIDTLQLKPVHSAGESKFKAAGVSHNLSGLTWLAILVVFFLERLISLKHKKELHG